MKPIDQIVSELQKSLDKGWKEFKKSHLFKKYSELSDILDWYNPNKAHLRKVIPYPAYHLATQEMGKYFMIKLSEYGLYSDEIFPGDFARSKETKDKYFESRHFKLSVYHSNELIGYLSLSLPHTHDKFDFPSPPKLNFKSVKNRKKQKDLKIGN